jgi:uncharacterized protein
VAYNVEAGFDEAFTKSGVDDSYTYSGNTVSLDKMVYDYLMLSLPQKILCRDDCKGLCPVLGQTGTLKTADAAQTKCLVKITPLIN